ncbi:high-affinity hexose transporter Hxt7p [Trichomonascus vanleenenianus]|uniref:sugar porter family MFS transporter n=1 Tax=Trichomonascus vanleenenianus TaxID=2268995 RepID=UPI003ECA512E
MWKVYNVYVTAFIATIGGMIFGFDISSVSAFVSEDAYRSFFNYPDSLTQGGITSAMAGGSFIGSLCAGYFSDRFGRKYVIQGAAVFWCIGAAIQSSSQNVTQLIFGRLISGFGIGFSSSQVPVYLAELSPKNIRGRLVGIFQWAITWGIMIMFYISFGCAQINGVGSFRLAWGIQIIPGLILFLGVCFLAESPRWLASKDRWEEAIDIIANVQANGDVNNPQVLIEIEEIKETLRIDEEAKGITVFTLFKKENLNRTMVGVWGQIWQQLCGMNVMMYYIVFIFNMAGFSGNTALVSSSIQYVINVVMTIPALLFIDRWGRRPMFIFGGIFMTIFLMLMAILLGVYSNPVPAVNGNTEIRILIPPEHKAASKGVIACSYLFVATFAPTWGPGMWIYCSEIFPTRQRAVANGLTAASNWIFNWALALFVPAAFANITWRTYILFMAFCFTMTIHVFLLFPETKGKTLEEIEQVWAAKIPAWKTGSFVPSMPSVHDIKEITDDIHIRPHTTGGTHPSEGEKTGVEHHEANPNEGNPAIPETNPNANPNYDV